MRRELVVSAGPGEWRAALLEDGSPVELRVERGDGDEFGSIHLGRVLRLLPALGAALVEIGGNRPAFLPHSETYPRHRRLAEGERVLVQIRREAQGGKAARLSTAVGLRGRDVELVLGRPGIAGAEALAPTDHTLLLAAAAAVPDPRIQSGAGSPAALGVSSPRISGQGRGRGPTPESLIGLRIFEAAAVESLIAEVGLLRRKLDDILERAAHQAPPARLYPATTRAAALAGVLPTIDRILVDDPAAIPETRAAFPDAVVAHQPPSDWPVDLDALFDEALSPTVALPGDGSLHVEPTRAAVLVDIDSGTPEAGSPERTALAVDLAAAETVARQLRLRNLGGGIVVDFVGLDDRGARERVRAALARALAADPLRPQLLGWTRLGHFELVRRRRTRPLADALLEPAPGGALVRTAATLAYQALRALRREARISPQHAWRLTVAPEVAAALAGDAASALHAVEEHLGRAVLVAADASLGRDRFQITPI
jgi:Ribonuclease G/E